MKNALKSMMAKAGIYVSSHRKQNRIMSELQGFEQIFATILELRGIPSTHAKAQIGQDVAALLVNGFKRDGYFVEFGATDGVGLSNTVLLERQFGWTGILAEPSPAWHEALKANRTCEIDTRCVWRSTGEKLEFDVVDEGELSTIAVFSDKDRHRKKRKQSSRVLVETVSLNDLLDEHGAPDVIDYLSVDTEGSEYDILSTCDFSKRKFNFVSVEHNYTPYRQKIAELFQSAGYEQVFPGLSKWDDWFIPKSQNRGLLDSNRG